MNMPKGIKKQIALSETVAFLSSLAEIDPRAMTNLIYARVSCNTQMADHETVQVSVEDDGYEVGFLGIINGLFGVMSNGSGIIAAYFDTDTGLVTHFGLLPEPDKELELAL